MSTKGKSTGTTNYRFVGDHATEFVMDSGTVLQVGPGDFIELTQSEYDGNPEKNEWLLDVAATVPTTEELAAFKMEQGGNGETTPAEEVTTSAE